MSRLGQIVYGALFVIALPVLLFLWARALDRIVGLPVIGAPWHGVLLAAAGAALMVSAMIVLRMRGRGWPMSPFPPERRVTSGPYALVDHPIYTGAVLVIAGVAVALQSAAGIWIVTPLLAMACAAFVIGYERPATDERFGPRPARALLRLPDASDVAPSAADRISIYLLVFLPWYIAYEGVNLLGVPRDALQLGTRWDAAIPVLGWTEPAYFLAYPLLLALPLVVRTRGELRRFALQGWIAIISITTVYLVFPTFVDAKPVPPGTALAPVLMWERAFDDHSTGFPAFHVIWPCIAAASLSRTFPRAKALWWILATAIAVSAVTTGMHVIADVVGAAVATVLILNADRIWRGVLRGSERIAASWREWDLGAVRLLSHGIYAGAGALFGIVVVGTLAGAREIGAACFVAMAAIVGAGLWAQFLEGSPSLLRPFGFYGGLLGGALAIALLPVVGSDGWLVFGAYAVAAPVVQAFGRVRCLVQGCCHGRPSTDAAGMRYTHARSRVTRLSHLAGRPLHPTQVYSIVWSIVTFVLLARLWAISAPLSFIAGSFFILNGLGRFVEEHFRGEPQTPIVAGLRVYQWLAIVSIVAGAVLMAIRTAAAPPASSPAIATWIAATAVGIVTYIAYGVDFPRLNARFARLV
ncbi:MAG: prolipoprotein diacylglyceryl transferase family protein [Thermoanaerobaculia bacterium]